MDVYTLPSASFILAFLVIFLEEEVNNNNTSATEQKNSELIPRGIGWNYPIDRRNQHLLASNTSTR